MSKYGKKKFGCLKYIIFAMAIIFTMAYTFTKVTPKASQMAKEEVTERLFGAKETALTTVTDSVIKIDSIKVSSNVSIDIVTPLKNQFCVDSIDIIYVGIPETRVPYVREGKVLYANVDAKYRAKSIKFKLSDGLSYNVYIVYDFKTGKVIEVVNDERYANSEKPSSPPTPVKDKDGNPDYTNNADI